MRIDSSDIRLDPTTVTHIRMDRIGGAADGLWWVADAMTDGSAKPEGMFTNRDEALSLANSLAEKFGVEVRVTTDL